MGGPSVTHRHATTTADVPDCGARGGIAARSAGFPLPPDGLEQGWGLTAITEHLKERSSLAGDARPFAGDDDVLEPVHGLAPWIRGSDSVATHRYPVAGRAPEPSDIDTHARLFALSQATGDSLMDTVRGAGEALAELHKDPEERVACLAETSAGDGIGR